jgi:hypothetical protein
MVWMMGEAGEMEYHELLWFIIGAISMKYCVMG